MATSVDEKQLAHEIEQLEKSKFETTQRAGDLTLVDENGNTRRIPIPTNDPNDPLNFSKWRKLGILVSCCWFSIFSLVLVGGVGPIIPVFMEMYIPQGRTPDEIISLSTYPSVTMAGGAFIILPLSMMFGRRPVFLGCCALLIATTIGAATAKTFDVHMACRILQGVATGATESVLPLIITDVSFVNERGKWFAWYWGSQNFVNTVFTISSSYLVAATSWHWFYWVLAILEIVGTIGAFILLPETMYTRSPMLLNGRVIHTDEFGVTTVLTEEEARSRFSDQDMSGSSAASTQKRTFLQELNPCSGIAPNALRIGGGAIWKMAQACSSPAILWAILASSISLGTGIAMTLVYGEVLTKGHGWSQASVGLINVGIFPASIAAMLYAGWFGDKLNIFMAKRNRGIHTPEHTLLILVFPAIVSLVGIVAFAAGSNWPSRISDWGVIMGWTIFEFGFIVVLVTTTHFASEAIPENPGPALAVVIGAKNVVSFGASKGIVPMVHSYNYMVAFMILFGTFAGIFLLGIPLYLLNPMWRKAVAKKNHT
ncbi:major facilitator superfamily domain-containing protein [Phaeosphaeria sp. MPI-PUGE-AT-0046c]|nr:major facilitator superfamily domain-containing protein [Phaeosphaeria sp. MPI-PUGE-AT-0046c]